MKFPLDAEPIIAQNMQNQDEILGIRRSLRIRKPAISSNYVVYLQESNICVGLDNNPSSFSQAIEGKNSSFGYDAMKEEMESIAKNQVLDLVELPDGHTAVGYKWIYKTKKKCIRYYRKI